MFFQWIDLWLTHRSAYLRTFLLICRCTTRWSYRPNYWRPMRRSIDLHLCRSIDRHMFDMSVYQPISCLLVCRFTCQLTDPSTYRSTCWSAYRSTCLIDVSMSWSDDPSADISLHIVLSIYGPLSPAVTDLSFNIQICLLTYQSTYLSTFRSSYLPINSSTYLYVYLSKYRSVVQPVHRLASLPIRQSIDLRFRSIINVLRNPWSA
jgi:hypothetical protein